MWYNSIVALVLRSPLHGFLSGNMLLLTYMGRKSNKAITLPISYVEDDDRMLSLSLAKRTWWRNLGNGAPVTLRLRGKETQATARAITADQANIVANVRAFLSRMPAGIVKGYGVTFDADGEMNAASIERLAQGKVVVEIRTVENNL